MPGAVKDTRTSGPSCPAQAMTSPALGRPSLLHQPSPTLQFQSSPVLFHSLAPAQPEFPYQPKSNPLPHTSQSLAKHPHQPQTSTVPCTSHPNLVLYISPRLARSPTSALDQPSATYVPAQHSPQQHPSLVSHISPRSVDHTSKAHPSPTKQPQTSTKQCRVFQPSLSRVKA